MALFQFKKKEENSKKPAVELYLEHLDRIFQQESLFFRNESTIEGVAGVTAIVYKDIPEPGYVTGFTYGLSLVKHPAWKFGRPELCITVQSDQIDWGQVPAFLSNSLRGTACSFTYGEILNLGEKVHEESEMKSFLIFAPCILDKSDYLNIDIGLDYKININGLYPIYEAEKESIQGLGLKDFLQHPNFDMYDVKRKKVS